MAFSIRADHMQCMKNLRLSLWPDYRSSLKVILFNLQTTMIIEFYAQLYPIIDIYFDTHSRGVYTLGERSKISVGVGSRLRHSPSGPDVFTSLPPV